MRGECCFVPLSQMLVPSGSARVDRADGVQRKALIPVMARPTMSDWMESVPS